MLLTAAAPAGAAETKHVVYSAIFPGLGQFSSGRYTRGTILMGAEIISLVSLALVDIQYDRQVEAYDRAKLSYENATYIGDAESYYNDMLDSKDSADNYNTYRKALAGAAVGVWVVNVADMLWGKDAGVPLVSMEVRRDGFMIAKNFSF
jgi:hypothetical protein